MKKAVELLQQLWNEIKNRPIVVFASAEAGLYAVLEYAFETNPSIKTAILGVAGLAFTWIAHALTVAKREIARIMGSEALGRIKTNTIV